MKGGGEEAPPEDREEMNELVQSDEELNGADTECVEGPAKKKTEKDKLK